ncbi:hypothetical protein CMQ_2463 [Grosmannia clavigera kw1407]|uniref:Uncharacterized protein n=1 Tax=Grosmannia clavigera (strain kw1407 / UAMH 11150) TaxID=655863 RepID=F0XJK2_GROCL|nr:uncharacterized protein CMQ_2463 [Grosmannia clavigera kw1407]EFX02414.1 hypothetical protein CMQ_2463 [Grosmannia clavigera kw1407]
MPYYHEAFNNSSARYDKTLGRYVPASIAMVKQTVQCRSEADERVDQFQLARPLLGSSVLMRFWNNIFTDSLHKFNSQYSEPRGRADSDYAIRNADDWEGVYSKLQLAREKYDSKAKGCRGSFKRFTRKVADQAGSAARLAKFIPEGTCTTPVKAAVEVLLDAVKVASEVRKEVNSFDGEKLDQLFADIEVFLGTYPKDENIKKASVDLVVAILKAVEDAIGFFTKHSG